MSIIALTSKCVKSAGLKRDCLPAFGSTVAVLGARLDLVAANDVLLTTSTGFLSCGGTTVKGLGWHFGEGS